MERLKSARAGRLSPGASVSPAGYRPAADADAAAPPGDRFDIGMFGYARCDQDGVVLSANTALARWLGQFSPAALAGRKMQSLVHDKKTWQSWWVANKKVCLANELLCTDGQRKPVTVEAGPTLDDGSVELWFSESPDAAMISRIARLEATLTLTAGTVHDVNNMLTVLSGNLFLLTEKVREQDTLFQPARRARNAAERASTLLRELLTFNRDKGKNVSAISPANHVRALEPLLSRAVGADRELQIKVEGEADSVAASAAQFESALINLVINARDAVDKDGRIRIDVVNYTLDAERAPALGVEQGEYVCLRVRDNGSGISKENLSRVTQALFTTKPVGSGSGLGLAMVRHFAEEHGGALQIDSVLGQGTDVRVWLPRAAHLAETTANMTLPLSTLPGGDARVVLISRDPDVRTSMQQILESLGYSVTTADSIANMADSTAEGPPPQLVICERSESTERAERNWLASLRETGSPVRQIALLQAGADGATLAPDADAHICRPVAVLDLARTVHRVLKDA